MKLSLAEQEYLKYSLVTYLYEFLAYRLQYRLIIG